ncbi:hypothetical protein QUD39_03860 [Staphylococcus hyicus]|uniref:hypothetical protein n=1 Tax=Staphylococcus hyicus TaxID=1284 RepID=UPI00273890C7|nr:hypothetical protein [Staphylococcus hyicus]MDP4460405.1 hypothetical protein [Staphylococcus hyicus]
MAKIKVKKKMNLAELLKWACVNGITNKRYVGNKGGEVYFNGFGEFRPELNVFLEDIFTIEVEEEITEETKIPMLVEVYKWHENDYSSTLEYNTSVSFEKDETSVAFYMLNDDMTMTLLWRNGGMVE